MKKYLTDLITEKGKNVDDAIGIPGHYGLTWNHLIEFIENHPEYHKKIKDNLVVIDFNNGDVFHFLKYLAEGMIETMEI